MSSQSFSHYLQHGVVVLGQGPAVVVHVGGGARHLLLEGARVFIFCIFFQLTSLHKACVALLHLDFFLGVVVFVHLDRTVYSRAALSKVVEQLSFSFSDEIISLF